MSARNLIVIINQHLLDYRDFEEIGQLVVARNSTIRFSLFSVDDDIANFPNIDWRLPTFTVSLSYAVNSLPKRGTIFYCRQIDKVQQLKIMHQAGIRVPATAFYHRHYRHDPSEWGEFVIVKSREIEGSSSGKTAHLVPTRYLHEPEEFDEPVRSILLGGKAIVQEFIPTGRNPTNHRACMFLGRVLYLMKVYSTMELPELDPHSRRTYVFDSNLKDAASGIRRELELVSDPDMLSLAQKIARSFPGIPLLGLDIQRNEKTGALFPLEINSGGNTWHFSSPSTVETRKILTRKQRIDQFGAWNIAANALVEKTLYYAK